MPLIKPKVMSEKEKLKIVLNSEIVKDIKEYCTWANVSESEFFEQATNFVFNKDKDWKNRNKKSKINT